MKEPQLIANTAWSFAGNSFYAVCQWAILAVMAKLGDPRMVGQFALALALAAPVFLFTNLQLRAIQTTDTTGEFSFADYLGLRIVTTGFSVIVIMIVVLTAGYPWVTAQVILAITAMKAFEAISDVFHGDLQRRERMNRISFYLAAKGLLAVLAVIACLRIFGSASVAAAGMAIVFGVVLLTCEVRFAPTTASPRWNWRLLRQLAWMGFPLGAAMMLISLNSNMPRYFINRSLGTYSLGIFAALSYLSFAATTLVNALGLAATPRLARLFSTGERSVFLRLLLQMAGGAALLGMAGVTVLLALGRPLLSLIYGAPYAAHLGVAVWVIVAGGVSCVASVFGYGMTAARSFRPQLPLFAVVTAVSAAAAFLLVPRFGLVGAAWSQLITAATQLIGSGAIVAFCLNRKARGIIAVATEMAA